MDEMFKVFFSNMTLLISFIYISNRLKDYIIRKYIDSIKILRWIIPVTTGILTILVIADPFEYNQMRFDLRSLPIFLISYIVGWRLGLLSIILPALFRFFLGGPSVYQGIFLSIILPFLVGGLFHIKEDFNVPTVIITFKKVIAGFLSYHVLAFLIGLIVMDVSFSFWIKYNLLLVIFSLISLIVVSLMINDSNQRLIEEEKLEKESYYDPLTELHNRRYCKIQTKKFLNQNSPLGVAMLDIDHFKIYNDTNGHTAGDEVLKEVAKILKDNIREDVDFVARYGGEEFIMFIKTNQLAESIIILERIRQQIEAFPFEGRTTQPTGKVTISIGVSQYNGHGDLQQVIDEADQALYDAKESGRNRVCVYKK